METLKKTRQFKKVYENGKSYATPNLVLYRLSNKKEYNRFGFSISKKIGNAVIRNKLRRRIKEIIRHNEKYIRNGYDLVFIARKPVVNLDFFHLKKNTIYLFKKSGIWKKSR
ncbi:MAG: ribonuclease P protein component [bacterium]